MEALIEHFRAFNLTDYSYLLTEPLTKSNRSELHAVIERALLADLASSLNDTKEMLIHFGRAVNARPASPNTHQQDELQPSISAQLAAVNHEHIAHRKPTNRKKRA